MTQNRSTTSSRTVTLAAALALGLGAGLAGCGEGAEAGGAEGLAIEVGADGYEPSQVEATAGEPLTLTFTRVTDEGCGQELVIPAHDVRRSLPLNEPVSVTITPEEAGELRFTCGMDMYDGAIVVR